MTDTAVELAERYDGVWGEHPRYTVEQWRYEVANDNTRSSYWDFVLNMMEQEEQP